MYLYLCLFISVITIAVVAIPLWFFKAEKLEAGATENSADKLERVKKAILRRYIEEEEIHSGSGVAGVVWEQRKSFLINRYLDAARRLDYLAFVERQGENSGGDDNNGGKEASA